MSDITTAAPAGASEQSPTPDIGPMSQHAAAGLLADWTPDEPEAPAAADQGNANQTIEEAPSDNPPANEASEQTEETAPKEAAEPAPKAEPKADDELDEIIHGNARTRLRDGTVIPVSELKKGYDELRELRAKVPELTAAAERAQQYQAREAHIAQQEQFVQKVLPLALQQLQAQIPPAPDPELVNPNSPNYDPILYVQQDAQHKQGIARLQQAQTALQQHQAQQQQQMEEARAAETKTLIEENRRELYKRIPEISDPAKRREVYEGIVSTAAKYGITEQEVNANIDPRLVHMIHDESRDAAAYRRLMAQKSAVQAKTERAAPVQQPGRRVTVQEQAGNAGDELIKRAMKTGRQHDAAAALALFD